MATLDSLKQALEQAATATTTPSPRHALSDAQYSAGFDILLQGPGWATYQDFIIPQLSQQLTPLFNSRNRVSILEIGPGLKSILGHLPDRLRRKIGRYTAYEPNGVFATKCEEWLSSNPQTNALLPSLDGPLDIRRTPFELHDNSASTTDDDKYDVVLLCHSLYGMRPTRRFIEQALGMLPGRPRGEMVVVFHRDGVLRLDGLVCHQTTSFPTGLVQVADDDGILDQFSSFIAGFAVEDAKADENIRDQWRKVCRVLGRREASHPNHLLFSSPNVMMAFTQHATSLPELTALVPSATEPVVVKNREARLHQPAVLLKPTEVRHVQHCVQWAVKNRAGLTVVGGGHSGHCLWPNVVGVDMGAFDKVDILEEEDEGTGGEARPEPGFLVVAGGGCKTGDIIRQTTDRGLGVPLGSRPSVGAGLWLQGGIGHQARMHGLACDAVVGAVVIGLESGKVFVVGCVPSQHRPAGAVRPENEADLLWAIKGAGTNFGIVISVVFRAFENTIYTSRNWVVPLRDNLDAQRRLREFNEAVTEKLPRKCSADAYLFWDAGRLRLGVTMIESPTGLLDNEKPAPTPASKLISAVMGPEDDVKVVDSLGLFNTEMYMSRMHGGHGGGKTSAFKRCIFLRRIGEPKLSERLVAAVESRPSPLCYLHLLQGDGVVGDVLSEATAFGCRFWDFACVITGVWPRDQDGTEAARRAVQWVYDVAGDLLPLSTGAYGADLGPDPRDAGLAARAFGPNRPRLARLKRSWDPSNVLAYACPLPKAPMEPKLIILVTGESGAGKDYCAEIWAGMFRACPATFTGADKIIRADVVSISSRTKQQFAAASGADFSLLLHDREYKEKCRPALTAFYADQVLRRPRLPEELFLDAVYYAAACELDVVLITGMREDAPVGAYAHLVPDSMLIEVRVQASEETRRRRRGWDDGNDVEDSRDALDNVPTYVFDNEETGIVAAKRFAMDFLLPHLSHARRKLADMVLSVPDFPRAGIQFRHVLNICQSPDGIFTCGLVFEFLLHAWKPVGAVVSCEAGGFMFGTLMAASAGVPLVLIREAGKLPPSTVSVAKYPSHISSLSKGGSAEDSVQERIEMERDVIPKGASVVVVDDVLATGKTLCGVLRLLNEAGIANEQVHVLVVAEFPVHRGRQLLRQSGFGKVCVLSLLVFGDA